MHPVDRLADLDRTLEIPGVVHFAKGHGGLPKVVIKTPEVQGEMYLHGAHVTSWKPAGKEEVLFISSRSLWEDGSPIRGGVPICFPWFGPKAGDPTAPMHGFVRTRTWQLESITQGPVGVTVSMFIESGPETRKWFPGDFRLIHRVTFGTELSLGLIFQNTGAQRLRFEEALHTYFNVGDVERVRVRGLDSVQYLDKTDSMRKRTQEGDITIVSETDRVYLDTAGTVEMDDPCRRIRISKKNSRVTVVWNPWVQKAHAMPDFGDDEWKQMICIEACNVGDSAIEVAPGCQHVMKAVVEVLS
jgi:glucose-6-phosphate 1-epimerase